MQNPYLYQETATIPTNHNQQHLYLAAAGPVIRKPSQRLPTYTDDKITKTKQPQKITKNVYATPFDIVIPQHSYQLNSDVYNNEVSLSLLIESHGFFKRCALKLQQLHVTACISVFAFCCVVKTKTCCFIHNTIFFNT